MTLGEIAYETYRQQDGGRADNGSVRRSWQSLHAIQRQAWEAAALAVAGQARADQFTLVVAEIAEIRGMIAQIETNVRQNQATAASRLDAAR